MAVIAENTSAPDVEPLQRPFQGASGAGIRVAVIDSDVNGARDPIHARTKTIAIGSPRTGVPETQKDRLGYGTAAMAAIQKKARSAEYFAVMLFALSLRATTRQLLEALECYPPPLAGVPQNKNLRGISFRMANLAGFVVRACEQLQNRSFPSVRDALADEFNRWRTQELVGVADIREHPTRPRLTICGAGEKLFGSAAECTQ